MNKKNDAKLRNTSLFLERPNENARKQEKPKRIGLHLFHFAIEVKKKKKYISSFESQTNAQVLARNSTHRKVVFVLWFSHPHESRKLLEIFFITKFTFRRKILQVLKKKPQEKVKSCEEWANIIAWSISVASNQEAGSLFRLQKPE